MLFSILLFWPHMFITFVPMLILSIKYCMFFYLFMLIGQLHMFYTDIRTMLNIHILLRLLICTIDNFQQESFPDACMLTYALIWHFNSLYLKAYNCYIEALRIDPQFAIAWSNLAGLFMEAGDLDKALLYYKVNATTVYVGIITLLFAAFKPDGTILWNG